MHLKRYQEALGATRFKDGMNAVRSMINSSSPLTVLALYDEVIEQSGRDLNRPPRERAILMDLKEALDKIIDRAQRSGVR